MKPSIVEVIGERVPLRKAGKEYLGLCLFHPDHRASLSVSEEKELFHCFACGESGDVYDFIMKLDGVSFSEARSRLGAGSTEGRPGRPLLETARAIADWANEQTAKVNSLLREIGQRLELAEQCTFTEEQEVCERQWTILSDFADYLQNPKFIIEIYDSRADIEALLSSTEASA
ncbi:MAG: hypothetical protein HY695_25560 [Deltaproteobacteria bacterium]|nr:hypothetical protein [Deltaproteobacteria bacterium]